MIIDLTMELSYQTPVFPGSQPIKIQPVAVIKHEGWNETRMSLNSHVGTHIDAPYHMIDSGKTITEYPIEYFCGNGIVIDVRDQQVIELDSLSFKGQDIVLFYTGKAKNILDESYFDSSPVLSENTAEALIKNHCRLVGIDSWTIDQEPYRIHKRLLTHDILIIENIVSLGKLLNKSFVLYALPLPIKRGDGAPCRVIAVL